MTYHAAVSSSNLEELRRLLVEQPQNIDELNEKKETPLLVAVHNNNVPVAQILIEAGANLNIQDQIQDSPYLYAGAHGRSDILRLMLKRSDIDFTVYNRYGGNCIIPASEKGHLENVRILLADGRENINHINRLNWTALLEIVYYDNDDQLYQDIARALLEGGADPNIRCGHGKTALQYAKEKGFKNLEQLIIDFGGKE
ncbi:hypothetical protein PPL_11312 [Heterostelium album PN500]|uniref:Ankyrin repeat domain-containing protein n=1 Tax=Heterostelium pallidum (strain ATCC 26659 / Pp 5 / PN500) TaxID=670386 RepID=D3BT20_HETP5|nr:hypothetical protein PPL_11312 [Heterostelium album PN500]EFA75237.1 hypothetical protein PPL_11312 [Heterostelium album PN500]|eukprot:XP_020427371.1 hypothetical protein PPL_11312 [Heterostelium album PN500]